jgi:hypothetical protein
LKGEDEGNTEKENNDYIVYEMSTKQSWNFKKSMGTRNRGGTGLSYGPPGYIGWRNSFLGIDSWAP